MVRGAERFLLQHGGTRLCDDGVARDHTDGPANSLSHAAAHAASHTASHATAHTATHAAKDKTRNSATHSATPNGTSSPSRSRGPLQLRGWTVCRLGWSQAAVVLQLPPHLWAADGTAGPSGSLQLPGRLRELAGRLVCREEGVVLQGSWEGLP